MAATLVHRAVGERLICVHVDHGLMRKNETELLRDAFTKLGVQVIVVQARERFLAKLAGVVDPEEKRHIIGNEFIRVFEEEAAKLGQIEFLTQGTLYPDVIESATSKDEKSAAKIKSHHNVGGLPDDIKFQLIEPLRYLFKDEVRAVGKELGLPDSMVQRQPFPGPGLAIRIIGEVTAERLDTLREADWIVIDEIKAAGLYHSVWQSFALLTPVRSVGVMGDGRTYASLVAISSGHVGGRHDGRLGQTAVRRAGQDQRPHRQRGAGREPGGVRHQFEAAGHDRVGVTARRCRRRSVDCGTVHARRQSQCRRRRDCYWAARRSVTIVSS